MEKVFVEPMLEYYNSSAVSAVSKEWNNLRSMIIRDAVQRLVPQLQEEMALKLLSESRSVVVESYSQELWKYVSTPPVQVDPFSFQFPTLTISPKSVLFKLMIKFENLNIQLQVLHTSIITQMWMKCISCITYFVALYLREPYDQAVMTHRHTDFLASYLLCWMSYTKSNKIQHQKPS